MASKAKRTRMVPNQRAAKRAEKRTGKPHTWSAVPGDSPQPVRVGAGASAVPASLGVSRARQLKPVHVPRGWGGLHVEAPGCIVNIQTSGLSGPNGEPMTVVSVSADGDRYAGSPQWWALPGVVDSRGAGVRIMQTQEEPKPLPVPVGYRELLSAYIDLAETVSDIHGAPDDTAQRLADWPKLEETLTAAKLARELAKGAPESNPATVQALRQALRDVLGWYDSADVAALMSKKGEQAEYHRTLRTARKLAKGDSAEETARERADRKLAGTPYTVRTTHVGHRVEGPYAPPTYFGSRDTAEGCKGASNDTGRTA